MPLPNYGYHNKEKKEHQELKFKMAPEIVDDPDDIGDKLSGTGRKESRKKGKVTTGTIAIDLDRKMVFNEEKDANIWKPPTIDREEVEEVKKYSSPAHQNVRKEVRSALDSLISGNKAKQLQTTKEEKEAANLAHAATGAAKSRTSIAANPKSSFQAYGGREITKTGVSIQPKGTFKLDSKISLGSYNNSDTPKNGDLETSAVTSKSSYSSYSMTSSSSSSLFK